MNPRRTLSILMGAGLLSLVLSPVAVAHDSQTYPDNSGSISNLVSAIPDTYAQRFVKFGESAYTYEITFGHSLNEINLPNVNYSSNCVLSLNNVPIKNDTCANIITQGPNPALTSSPIVGVVESGADGNYVLSSSTTTLASWTFKRSPELPPAPSECAIQSVKPVSVKNKIVSITILDNGKCKGGLWSFTSTSDLTKKAHIISALGKNTYVGAKGLPLPITKGSTVTVTYESGDLFDTTLQKKFSVK